MSRQFFSDDFSGNAAENYENYFVPAIGEPLAIDLIEFAALRPQERVLDVACGTGVVTRLAMQRVGSSGTVTGLDINPGMIAVARSVTSTEQPVEWQEASAESIPLPDESFDVVLCQMGLQFMPDKQAALREIRRVLKPGGRLIINVPGPTPRMFSIITKALERHIGTDAVQVVSMVFSLHDPTELQSLLNGAGFHDVSIKPYSKLLNLPAPKDFLWQYVNSTPLSGAVAQADDEQLASLEQEVVRLWDEFVEDNSLVLRVRVTIGSARK
jgi:SAM-dependent methyltransferase